MATSARAPRARKTRKARTAGTVQASTNFIHNGTNEDSTEASRLQFLTTRTGISVAAALMLAPLIWEAQHG